MQNFLRISLLMVCLAMGTAVAVAVALRKPPDQPVADADQPAHVAEVAPPAIQPQPPPPIEFAAAPLPATTTVHHVFQPLGPVFAPYRDLVAQQPELAPPAPAAPAPASAPPPPGAPAAGANPFADDPATPAATPRPEPIPAGQTAATVEDEGDNKLNFNAQDSDIRDVLELISKDYHINIMASKSVTGTVTANLAGVDLNTALSAILKSTGYIARREGDILYVGTPADFLQMDQAQDEVRTRVYRPNYVKAADLQALITPMLTPQIGKVTVSSPSEIDIPADQTKTGGNNFA